MSFRRGDSYTPTGRTIKSSRGGYDDSQHDARPGKTSVSVGQKSPGRLTASKSDQKHRSFASPLEHNSAPSDKRFQRSISSATGSSSPSGDISPRHSVPSAANGEEIIAPLESLRGLTYGDISESAYELVLAFAGGKANVQPTPKEDKSKHTKVVLKKAFGFGKKPLASDPSNGAAPSTIVEILGKQMLISEAATSRIKKSLAKSGATQAGKRNSATVLPIELLQYTGIMDFTNTRDYTRFQRRQLSILEEGLIIHPALPPAADNMASAMRLKQAIAQLRSSEGQDLSSRRNAETMQLLRSSAYDIAEGVGAGGESEMHWADGFPLSAHLYLALLRSLFDVLEEGSLAGEMDDLLEIIKTTWPVLGINQTLHGVCFAWTLVHQYVATGKKHSALLSTAEGELRAISEASQAREDEELLEVGRKVGLGPKQINFLRATLSTIQTWGDKQLFAYHECFPDGASGLMENLLGIALEAEYALQAEEMQVYGAKRGVEQEPFEKCEEYIRSSVKSAFATKMGESDEKRRSMSGSPQPLMVVLANETLVLARNEEKHYCPALRKYHPSPGAVACATLHGCFRRELKAFLSEVTVLTPDAAQILSAASNMEKELINMAVMDSVEADDGGRAIIREMAPYDADNLAGQLAKQWVVERLERLKVAGDRTLQAETWDPNANREHYGPSVVDVMRLVDETLDAFFGLDLPSNPNLVKDMVAGLDRFFQRYAQKISSQCGAKDKLIPPLPPLTRYKKDVMAKIVKERKKGGDGTANGRGSVSRMDSSASPGDGLDLPRLCVRINTVHQLCKEIELVDKKICTVAVEKGHAARAVAPVAEAAPMRKSMLSWNGVLSAAMPKQAPKVTSSTGEPLPQADDLTKPLQETCDVMRDNIKQLCSYTACKVVYYDLRRTFFENLYACSVSSARMTVVMEQLEPQLMTIAGTLDSRVRNDLVRALMEASLDAVLRVLLAGGPSRAFLLKDAELLDDDLDALKEMFVADGHGLPGSETESLAAPVTQVLNLFHFDTATLIQNFQSSSAEGAGGAKGKIMRSPAPPMTTKGYLGFLKTARATDADTVLRVLCYRADHAASKFLKTKFDLPKLTK